MLDRSTDMVFGDARRNVQASATCCSITLNGDPLSRPRASIRMVSPKAMNPVEAVKKATSFHQLLWGTCRMLKDPPAYRRDAKKVGKLVENLIEALEVAALQGEQI